VQIYEHEKGRFRNHMRHLTDPKVVKNGQTLNISHECSYCTWKAYAATNDICFNQVRKRLFNNQYEL